MDNNRVINQIRQLGQGINPRPEWVKMSRDLLLQQIRQNEQPVGLGFSGYVRFFTQTFKINLVEPGIVMLLILGSFLTGSLVINAAFYSMPGQNLYKVKLALERTHVALVSDVSQKAELKIEFAQKRVAELDRVVNSADVLPAQKQEQVKMVTEEFKSNVAAVREHLAKISESIKNPEVNIDPKDKEYTLKMAVAISSKADDLAKSLDEQIAGLSAEDQSELKAIVTSAVESAQSASVSAQELVQQAEDDQAEGEVKGDSIKNTATSTEAGTEQLPAETGDKASTTDLNN